jgi:MFS family permease
VSESYRDLLVRPRARRLCAALGAAWLSFGMVGLAVFLTLRRATGSYGDAGLGVAAFSAGSGLLAPLRGRLVDRLGVSPWLSLLAAGYGASLVLLAVLAGRVSEPWALTLCAGAAGALAPPLVATVRGLWATTVEPTLLRRAYALTSLIGDVGLVVAPALGGLLFAVAPWSPLVVCAVAALVGAAVVSRAATPAAASGRSAARPAPPAASKGLRALLVVSVALGFALGSVEVAVPADAVLWGAASYSGFLLGAFALGSVAAGLWFGRRRWERPPEERYLAAVALLALALAPPVAAAGPGTLMLLLVVAGLGYGPATISLFEALDTLAPASSTEALTWVTTAEAIGAAGGAAAAGWAITGAGPWSPYALAAVVLAVTTAGAAVSRRRTAVRAKPARP